MSVAQKFVSWLAFYTMFSYAFCLGGQISNLGPKCGVGGRLERPTLSPPGLTIPVDVETLPEYERIKLVKVFEYVPKKVKIVSSYKYAKRLAFLQSKQYASVMDKHKQYLSRISKKLSAEPAVTIDEIQNTCNEIVTYGRMLTFGNMERCKLIDLAHCYGFDTAEKAVECIDDPKNFKRGIKDGWPSDQAECAAFAVLAEKAVPAQWRTFLERANKLKSIFADNIKQVPQEKREFYGQNKVRKMKGVPQDIQDLPAKDRLRFQKIFGMVPIRVRKIAECDYAKRKSFGESKEYVKLRSAVKDKIVKEEKMLSEAPAVDPCEILSMCDEMICFGRPLIMGEMRQCSFADVAEKYHFPKVAEFLRQTESIEYAKKGHKTKYPIDDDEFRNFEKLAKKVNAERWQEYVKRMGSYDSDDRKR